MLAIGGGYMLRLQVFASTVRLKEPLKNYCATRSAPSRARSPLAYLSDMSQPVLFRRGLRGSGHLGPLATFLRGSLTVRLNYPPSGAPDCGRPRPGVAPRHRHR